MYVSAWLRGALSDRLRDICVMRGIDENDLGMFWLGPDGAVWELFAYCARPTVSWRRVDDHEIRRGGSVGSSLAEEFTRLVPERACGHHQPA